MEFLVLKLAASHIVVRLTLVMFRFRKTKSVNMSAIFNWLTYFYLLLQSTAVASLSLCIGLFRQ